MEDVMSVERAIIEKLRDLPPDKQVEVLDFVESIAQTLQARRPRTSAFGLLAEEGLQVTEAEIVQARHEPWGEFPGRGN
jgi:hypothetical protein